ncbi:macro domain-containing protein, partial [Planctomycetota bacterium]
MTDAKSRIEIVQGDITRQAIDAIVNAANNELSPGGGVSGAIHRAAGGGLWNEAKTLGGCQTGQAKLTKGYKLKAKYVIHTVGPVYSGSSEDPKLLASSYRECLRLAASSGIKSIAFPAISTGVFGYPVGDAAKVALKTVADTLEKLSEIDLV